MHPWNKQPVFCFTSDIDWASESVIQYSHHIISGDNLKLTYFNTNPSAFLDALDAKKKAVILIHPNFLPDSSHGNSFSEVIDYCKKLAPKADGFRVHRHFEVNDIVDEFAKRGFKFFSNYCTRCEPNLRPLLHRSGMLGLPIFLEDGGYLLMDPTLNFDALHPYLQAPGLKIINFHPAHIAFNTPYFSYTRKIKDSMSREAWNKIDAVQIEALEYKDLGVRNIIQSIIQFAVNNQYPIFSMHEIYNIYMKSPSGFISEKKEYHCAT